MKRLLICALIAMASLIVGGGASWAAPSRFNVQGRLVRANGSAIEVNPVTLTLEVRSPNSDNCLLYAEDFTLNMTGSNGVFSVTTGTGTRSGVAFHNTSNLVDVLNNNSSTMTGLTCTSGTTYLPTANDIRNIVVRFNDGGGAQTLAQALSLNSVPYAIHARTLQGREATSFIQVSAATTQAKLDTLLATASYAELIALVGGTSTQYVSSAGANFTPASNLNFNNRRITNLADPSGAQDAATKNYCDARIAGYTTTGLGSLGAGQSGQTLTWNGSAWTVSSVSGLPSQATHAGKFLTTDGTNASWATVGGGSGTVTSVSASAPLTVTGTATTTPTVGFVNGTGANIGYILTAANGAAPSFSQLNLGTSGAITGTLPVANGGTGATTLTANQLILGNGTSALSSLSAGTSGQILRSAGASAPAWSAATYPSTVTANSLLYASAADTVAGLATANSAVLTTNGSGVPSWTAVTGDTFSQYALLAGRSSGQTLVGSTATNSGLTLRSTAGVGSSGADIVFQTGNNGATEAMRILNSGNVGIGTNNPTSPLHVVSSSSVNSQVAQIAGNFNYNPTAVTTFYAARGLSMQVIGQGSNLSNISLEGAEFSSILGGSSNINNLTGVRSQAANWTSNNINTAYGFVGTVSNTSSGGMTNAYGAEAAVSNSSTGSISNAHGLLARISRSSGTITNGYGVYIDTIQATNKYGLYQSDATAPNYFAGNVGIGTATTTARLHVEGGSMYVTGTDADNSIAVYNYGSSTARFPSIGVWNIMESGPSGHPILQGTNLRGSAGATSALQANDSLLVVQAIGSTGSGWATAPGGQIRFQASQNWSGSAAGARMIFATTTNGATSPSTKMLIEHSGDVGIGTDTPSYKLHVNGSVAGVGTYNNISDVRYKKNVTPVPDALTRISSIRGVRYDWKRSEYPELNFEYGSALGVIAQEIEEEFPEAVSTDPNGIKSVRYSMLIAPLIEATKELKSRVEKCEGKTRELATLETELHRTQEQLAQIQRFGLAPKKWTRFYAADGCLSSYCSGVM